MYNQPIYNPQQYYQQARPQQATYQQMAGYQPGFKQAYQPPNMQQQMTPQQQQQYLYAQQYAQQYAQPNVNMSQQFTQFQQQMYAKPQTSNVVVQQKEGVRKTTKEEAEAKIKEAQKLGKVNDQFQGLVRNMRILEILQRQLFADPMKLAEIQETRSIYFNAIQQQMQAQGVTIQQFRDRITQLHLTQQLTSAIEYVFSNSTKMTDSIKTLNRLCINCNDLLQALKLQVVTNHDVKNMMEDLISRFEALLGQEGCPPINWSGMKVFNGILAEAKTKATTNPGVAESWEHWVDPFEQLYSNQISALKWE